MNQEAKVKVAIVEAVILKATVAAAAAAVMMIQMMNPSLLHLQRNPEIWYTLVCNPLDAV